MELQIVSFEQAKALHKLGFSTGNDPITVYDEEGEVWNDYFGDDAIEAPSLELVAKWLREEKKIYVSPLVINTFGDYGHYNVLITCNSSSIIKESPIEKFYRVNDSYEDALSVGIDEAIEILERI